MCSSSAHPHEPAHLVQPLARLHLPEHLANRLQRIVDALGLDNRVDGFATVVQVALAYLPDPDEHAFHLASGFAEWLEALTELDRLAHTELKSLNRQRFWEQYRGDFPVLACLISQEGEAVRPQGRALKSLVLAGCVARDMASNRWKSLDIPVEDLANHVRLALEKAHDPDTARPLEDLPDSAVTMRSLRELGALERPSDLKPPGIRMSSSIRQVADRTRYLNSLDLAAGGSASLRSDGRSAPLKVEEEDRDDFEANQGLVFDEQVDGEPEEFIETVDAQPDGVVLSRMGLDRTAQRARFLAGEYAAPAIWSPRSLVPIERERLKDLFANLDALDSWLAAVLTVMVVTGRSVTETLATTVGPTGEITPQGVYRRSVPELETSTAESDSPPLELPLPAPIVDSLARALPHGVTDTRRLGTLLDLTDPKAAESEIGLLLRRRLGHRVRQRHVANALRRVIHAQTDNEVITFLLTGRTDQVPPVGLHYLSITGDGLREAFQRAMIEFFPEERCS